VIPSIRTLTASWSTHFRNFQLGRTSTSFSSSLAPGRRRARQPERNERHSPRGTRYSTSRTLTASKDPSPTASSLSARNRIRGPPPTLASAQRIFSAEGSIPSTWRPGYRSAASLAKRPWPQPTSRSQPDSGRRSSTAPMGQVRERTRVWKRTEAGRVR
jgi:hypothetical protein